VGHKLSILLLAGMFPPIWVAVNLIHLSAIAETIPTIPKTLEPDRFPKLPESLPLQNKFQPIQTPIQSPIQSPQVPSATPNELPEADVTVRQIRILGSTVFSDAELQQAVASYLGKPAKIQDLFAIRSIITDLYIRKGYLTSGAFLPVQSQDFNNGIISVQIIEGELERININGLDRLQENYVRSRIAQSGQSPINISQLEEGLQLLQADPLLKTLRAELKSGTTVGRNILDIELQESQPWVSYKTIENRESPSVGSLGIYASLDHRNLTGVGDTLGVDIGGSEGTRKYGIRYNLPINPEDELQFRYNYNTSRIIEQPFASLDINSRSQTISLGYRHFIFRHPNRELSLGLTFEQRDSRDFLLGDIPFSFAAGADNGRTTVNVLRFGQEWIERDTNQVLSLRSQFSLGLGILGATVNDAIPDARFFSWQGQFQWVQALEKETIAILRLGAQLTTDALLPIEQFGLGGIGTVRGYRQNLYVGDNGIFGNAELRLPIFRNEAIGLIQVVPFCDTGMVWSNSPNSFSGSLASVGLGLRWEFSPNMYARLEWAAQLVTPNVSANASPNQSIIFSLVF